MIISVNISYFGISVQDISNYAASIAAENVSKYSKNKNISMVNSFDLHSTFSKNQSEECPLTSELLMGIRY